MGIARSTYYADSAAGDDTALVEAIASICDEFEAYGWRRVQAALRQQGINANHKRIKRLMREHDLQPRTRRRHVATTDSDHDQPTFPNRTKGLAVDGPNQLWVADLTYVAIVAGFVYVALILDAWSRRVIGYAIGRSIDARLTMAALRAALAQRQPPPGCIVDRSTLRKSTASCSMPTAWSAPWGGAVIPMTMPRRRASSRRSRSKRFIRWPTRPSKRSPQTFRVSSSTSTTAAVFIPRSAI